MIQQDACVFVVDDDASVREALRNLLRAVGLRVETFSTAHEFLSSPRPDVPSCLVLDVRLPGVSGLDLQRRLLEAKIRIPIIFITAHGDIQMSVRAMKDGAVEFLTKPFRDQELLDAVQLAISRSRSDHAQRMQTAEMRRRYESLTAREREVMKLVIRGLANKQIASELGTSEATVKLHRGRVMSKMKADSLAALIRAGEQIYRMEASATG